MEIIHKGPVSLDQRGEFWTYTVTYSDGHKQIVAYPATSRRRVQI